jgi:GntR family transcriptional regulator
MSNSPIDTQEMVRLYVDEGLSVREIATRYGRSYGKIYNMLRNRVIMRPSKVRGSRRDTEYRKVAEIIRERIVTGDWPPNRKILSQNELALIFGVGLSTIRVAIADLRQRGYLTTKPNKNGIYVRPPQDWEAERGGA